MKPMFCLAMLAGLSTAAIAATNGEVRRAENAAAEAFNGETQAWLKVEDFWDRFALAQGGLTWGRSATYPPYEKVRERDLFLVEVEQGTCLMEFFHGRWRRANDVRRWDDAMNEVGGCAHVFK